MLFMRAVVPMLALALHAFAFDVDPVGRYQLQTTSQNGQTVSIAATIVKLPDGKFGGELSGSAIQTVKMLDLTVKDSTITFTVQATDENLATVKIVVSGNSVSGEWSMANNTIKLSGRRLTDAAAPARDGTAAKLNLAGAWTYSAPSGVGNVRTGDLTIVSHGMRGYSAVWASRAPDADSSNVKVTLEDGAVKFRIPTRSTPARGEQIDRFVTIVALPQTDGTLKGRWYREGGGTGDWIAVRK
jgi:hypothetical protein